MNENVIGKAGEREGEEGGGSWWDEVKKWLGRKVEMEGGWQGSGASIAFREVE